MRWRTRSTGSPAFSRRSFSSHAACHQFQSTKSFQCSVETRRSRGKAACSEDENASASSRVRKSCSQAFERERKSWSGLICIGGRGFGTLASRFLALREFFEELFEPELVFAI